ncbi:hypothetical protein [Vulcanisaeta distributa]|nr:hypothetical protein [Vulcanisaeta distributa]
MCTIGGVLIFGDKLDRDRANRIEEVLRMIIVKGEERGSRQLRHCCPG